MEAAANKMYRFTITRPRVVPDLVKALVVMALRETDLVFGPTRRKIETDVGFSAAKPICWIAGGTECGEHLARLVCGFLIKQVGEDGFLVKRYDRGFRVRKGGSV
jgi:hypothetical protein